MDLAVDFNHYNLPDGIFSIKEFSFRSVLPDANGNYYENHNVVTPPLIGKPYDQEQLKICYEPYYETYGIPWDAGVTNYSFMRTIFELHLRDATCIYVRNSNIKNLLMTLMGNELNIISLYDYDYTFDPPMHTNCLYHDNPNRNNCANDNTINMVNWLVSTKLYLPETRNKFIEFKNRFIESNQMECTSVDETNDNPQRKKRKLND